MRQGMPGFNGKRLKEARDMRGLTITSLAEMVGVTKQAISRYEKGEVEGKTPFTPRPETLDRISTVLNFPKTFFLQGSCIANTTPIHYRSLSTATKAARLRAESKFMWFQEITNFLKQYVDLPEPNLPKFGVNDYTKLSSYDIEEFATATRRHWGLGDRPISNVVTLLENNGVMISRIDLEADTLDALSQFADHDGIPYVFLSSSKQSSARSKFDLCHELAHLCIHNLLNKSTCQNLKTHSDIEKQAHRFSSAFLLPVESFTKDLNSPTLDGFWALKDKWQVSIKAMIVRCRDLDIIDDDYARTLFINYNRRGWAKREPLDDKLPIEQPKLLRRSYELLVKEKVLAVEDITDQLPYPQPALEEIIGLPIGFLSSRNNVEFFPTLKRTSPKHDTPILFDSKVIKFPSRK
jgi:Zn-dependent peptidase ImmA (M78 family)/DNA-binding XRE family transcriptional regulator